MWSTLTEAESLDVFKVEQAKQQIPVISNYNDITLYLYNYQLSLYRASYVDSVLAIALKVCI